MLLWLPKKLSRKTLFFSELVFVSASLHCVIGLALFVLYRGQYESFNLQVRSKLNSKDLPVLFLAHRGLQKSSMNGLRAHSVKKSGARGLKTQCRQNASKPISPNKKNAQQKCLASACASTKKLAPKSATMFLDKPIKQMNHASKIKNPAKSQKTVTKDSKIKVAEMTPQPSKKVVEDKNLEETEKSLKDVDSEKPAPAEQKIADAQEAPAVCAQAVAEGQRETDQVSDVSDCYEIAVGNYVGSDDNGDQEYGGLSSEVARIYFVVQEEIATRWKPPTGLPQDLVCTIAVRLDREGSVADVSVKKSSGVLIYDLSAGNAAQEMQLPRIAWGKEFSIAFKL